MTPPRFNHVDRRLQSSSRHLVLPKFALAPRNPSEQLFTRSQSGLRRNKCSSHPRQLAHDRTPEANETFRISPRQTHPGQKSISFHLTDAETNTLNTIHPALRAGSRTTEGDARMTMKYTPCANVVYALWARARSKVDPCKLDCRSRDYNLERMTRASERKNKCLI